MYVEQIAYVSADRVCKAMSCTWERIVHVRALDAPCCTIGPHHTPLQFMVIVRAYRAYTSIGRTLRYNWAPPHATVCREPREEAGQRDVGAQGGQSRDSCGEEVDGRAAGYGVWCQGGMRSSIGHGAEWYGEGGRRQGEGGNS